MMFLYWLLIVFAPPATDLSQDVSDGAINRPSVEAVLDGIQSRGIELKCVQYDIHERIFSREDPGLLLLEREIEFVRVADKRRFRRTYSFKGQTRIYTAIWDGERQGTLTEVPELSSDYRFSGLIRGEDEAFHGITYWRTVAEDGILSTASQYNLWELVQENQWSFLGEKRVGRYIAWGIGAEVAGGPMEVWVAPEHGFAPVEITSQLGHVGQRGSSAKLTDVQLAVFDGMWVIVEANVVVTHWLDGKEFPQSFSYRVRRFERQAPQNADDLFTIRFPVGTVVLDDFNDRSFVAGKVVRAEGGRGFRPISEFPEYEELTDYGRGIGDEEWEESRWAAHIQASNVPSDLGREEAQRSQGDSGLLLGAVVTIAIVMLVATYMRRRRMI